MELCTAAPLLDDKGILITPGWARYPYWEYNRKKAGLRVALKEWDSYTITDEGKGFSFQIIYSDLGYSGIFSIAFFDHIRKKASEVHGIKLFPKQRTLSENPGADSAVTYADSSMTIAFVRKGLKHQILITAPYLMLPDGSTGFKADAVHFVIQHLIIHQNTADFLILKNHQLIFLFIHFLCLPCIPCILWFKSSGWTFLQNRPA